MHTGVLAPDGLDSHITATEAATLCGVTTQAIANWVTRGHLRVAGIDDRGRRTYLLRDVARVELKARQRLRKMCR